MGGCAVSILQDDFLLEQRVRFGELFDLYSSLLTEKQRTSCELMLRGDLSVAELGEELHMTRQGAHDLIRRSRDLLEEIEQSLGLFALKERHQELLDLIEENRSALPTDLAQKMMKLLVFEEEPADV